MIFEHGPVCVTMSCMSTLTIRIPEEMRTQLDTLSRQRDQRVSDLVRESLRRYIAVEKFRELRRQIVPCAKAAGFFTDEDVFKAVS